MTPDRHRQWILAESIQDQCRSETTDILREGGPSAMADLWAALNSEDCDIASLPEGQRQMVQALAAIALHDAARVILTETH